MKLSLALALATAVGYASAMCPNSCSGNGDCLNNDECTCYASFTGNDCSQRQCPSHASWVVTSNGDVNSDGDTVDATSHSNAVAASNLPTYFNVYDKGTGHFESWPATKSSIHAGVDEGHYQMECANQGLCDYKTGMCQCFEGYEGVACRRSACPNQCSNAGVCRTVSQIGSSLSSYTTATFGANADPSTAEPSSVTTSAGALNYNLWDKDMSQACVCDAGFAGADCSERLCAMGDDPLTLGQHAETQFVDVSADVEFTGTVRFLYTDVFGATWTTVAVATTHYNADASAASLASLASDAEAALVGLPGNVLGGTTVSVGYCEKPTGGYHKHTISTCDGSFGAASTNTGLVAFAPAAAATPSSSFPQGYYRVAGEASIYKSDGAGAGSLVNGYTCKADGDTDDVQVNIVSNPYCIRYEVHFGGRSGDVASLSVDLSNVLTKTVVAVSATHSTTVDSDGVMTLASLASFVNLAPNAALSVHTTVHISINNVNKGFGTVTGVSGTQLTIQTNLPVQSVADTAGSAVISYTSLHTTGTAVNNVASTTTDELALGSVLVDSPKVQACDGAGTTACDGYSTMCIHAAITSEAGADVVASGGEIATSAGVSTLTCAASTAVSGDGTTQIGMNTALGYGDQVKVYCTGISLGTYTVTSSTADTVVFAEAVPDCNTNFYDDATHTTKTTRNAHVYLERTNWVVTTAVDLLAMEMDFMGKTVTLAGTSCDVSMVLADSASATTGSRFVCSNTAGASAVIASSSGASAIVVSGKGTTEATSCSDRGMCNTETGLCECFTGYSGVSCSLQNALSA